LAVHNSQFLNDDAAELNDEEWLQSAKLDDDEFDNHLPDVQTILPQARPVSQAAHRSHLQPVMISDEEHDRHLIDSLPQNQAPPGLQNRAPSESQDQVPHCLPIPIETVPASAQQELSQELEQEARQIAGCRRRRAKHVGWTIRGLIAKAWTHRNEPIAMRRQRAGDLNTKTWASQMRS